jgi:MFS family permease
MDRGERANAARVVGGDAVWGFQASLVAPSTVLAVLLLRHGAGPAMVSSILALEAGATVLPQILGNYLVRSAHHRKRFLILWHLAAIIPFLFGMAAVAGFAGRMGPAAVRWGLLAGYAGYNFAMGIIMAVWLDWIADVFRERIRGTVFGLSFAFANFAGSAASLLAGAIIGSGRVASVYGWLYTAAGLLAAASMTLFALVRDPTQEHPDRLLRLDLGTLLRHFRRSLADANFRSYIAGRALATAGFSIMPFFAVYYTSARGGALSEGTVVASGAAMTAGAAVASLLVGRHGDRRGHRGGMLIGLGLQGLTVVSLLTTRGPVACALAYAGAGLARGSVSVSGFNLLYETCPHDGRFAHITLGNFILSFAAIGAPLAAGLAAGRWGLRPLFVVSLGLCVAALAWFLVRVKDPRSLRASGSPAA